MGCGKGVDITYLKERGWDVLGVDLPNVDLNLPHHFGHEFDLVFSIAVLQFIKHKSVFVDTCFDNLKSGGRLFILTFHKDDTNFKTELFDAEELRNLFKEKFKDIKIEKIITEDNYLPIGRHDHVILVVTALKI